MHLIILWHRHNPSSSTEVGGIVANIGFQNEDQTYTVKRVKVRTEVHWFTSSYCYLQGYPDLSVVVEDDPHVFLAIGEVSCTKGISSREAARGHATNVDGIVLSVTINRIYNY